MANSAANAKQFKDALFESVSHGDVEKTKTILQSNSEVDINKTVHSKGRNLLHLACEHGHINMVRWLVSLGADVNKSGLYYRKFTPLSLAVLNNHTSIVSALVSEFGCDYNDGVSLHTACRHGNLSMVRTLIKCGSNVNGRDADGNTPLYLTARNEREKTMQALLNYLTCDPNVKNVEERTPLHIACVCGNLDGVKLLIKHGARVNVKDIHCNTPLSLAVKKNDISIVSALVSEFGCDPNDGMSLHTACEQGNLRMAKTLIECGANVNGRDADGNTLLHLTARNERKKTMQALFNCLCDPNIKNKEGRTSLHIACVCGNLGGVKLLIKHGARVDAKDIHSNTPLSLAVLHNHTSVVLALVSEFGCDPNDGISLHTACEQASNLSMVKTLIEYGNVNGRDANGNSPLHLTARNETMQALLNYLTCDPNIKNKEGRTPLHIACVCGNLGGVKLLIKHGARVNVKDIHDSTPLSLAVLHNHTSIVLALMREFGCDPNDGVSLHTACKYNDINSVNTLIIYDASLNDRDVEGNTPLYYGSLITTQTLLSKFKCDPNVTNKQGMSPLHCACIEGDSKRVGLLIEYGARVSNKNAQGNTSFELAVQNKDDEVASLLLNHDELICSFDLLKDEFLNRCFNTAIESGWDKAAIALLNHYERWTGRSLLHKASRYGNCRILELLICEYGMSPLLVDEEGNTPLHLCSESGKDECVWSLLYNFHSPVSVRNRAGKTPRDVCYSYSVAEVFHEYIVKHQEKLKKDYELMQKLAATRYSGSHCITRVFVVGHPGAGKSSLVEALKREGFIKSFNRVSSKSVALHTAGIVPSIHTSDSYGRVQFYDFAGDPEYYSSHAAILEKLFLSDIGNNICIVVLNLVEEDVELEKKYLYWLTFINHNTMNLQHPPSVIVTGSHADLLSRQGLQKKEDCIKSLLNETDHVYLPLDCCGPRSTNIKLLRQQIQELSKEYEPYNLSYEGSALLGLLEKDFSSVTACTAETIASHISELNLLRLPTSPSGLYPILKQLQAIGSLLILGGKEEDCYLVLNVSQLTNEVHKRLFSDEAFSNKPDIASFNIGLLPQSLLQNALDEVISPFIVKECLTQLQYCQEISHVEIGQDYSISPSTEEVHSCSSPSLSRHSP